MAWLSVPRFRVITILPPEEVDNLNARRPGFLAASIDDWQSHMMGQLSKRYAVEDIDDNDVPKILERWLNALVTREAYGAKGYTPSSEMDEKTIDGRAERAEEQIQLAANSETGLYDLPLRASQPGKSGVTKSGPRYYTEVSPYDWLDRQACLISHR